MGEEGQVVRNVRGLRPYDLPAAVAPLELVGRPPLMLDRLALGDHLELQLDACDRTVAVHAHADRPDRLERHEIDAAADVGQLIRTRLGGAGHVDQLQVRGEQPARGVRVGVKLSTEQCPLGGTNLIGRRSPRVRVGTRGRVRRFGKYEDRGGQRDEVRDSRAFHELSPSFRTQIAAEIRSNGTSARRYASDTTFSEAASMRQKNDSSSGTIVALRYRTGSPARSISATIPWMR